jgi:steroid delta-isomerase-like uncharacterized protein
MQQDDMIELVLRHFRAEGSGDIEGAVAVYTDDIEHDAVGFPGSPRRGKDAAREFYKILCANFLETGEDITHQYATDEALVIESTIRGKVIGALLGLPGNGKEIAFRMLHVFEFRDGLISRENVWIDSAAIVAQLSPNGGPAH